MNRLFKLTRLFFMMLCFVLGCTQQTPRIDQPTAVPHTLTATNTAADPTLTITPSPVITKSPIPTAIPTATSTNNETQQLLPHFHQLNGLIYDNSRGSIDKQIFQNGTSKALTQYEAGLLTGSDGLTYATKQESVFIIKNDDIVKLTAAGEIEFPTRRKEQYIFGILGDWLIFSSFDPDTLYDQSLGSLTAMSLDGTYYQVISEQNLYYRPAISPDGSQLIYVVNDGTEDKVFAWQANGQTKQLPIPPFFSAAISPDGAYIALSQITQVDIYDLATYSLVVSDKFEVMGKDSVDLPVWSPNSQQLAINSAIPENDQPFAIRLISINSAVQDIPTAYNPVFSPDGQWMAVYNLIQNNQQQIEIIHLATNIRFSTEIEGEPFNWIEPNRLQATPVNLLVGEPTIFIYHNGVLGRTDVNGSGFERLTPFIDQVDEEIWRTFFVNPPQVSPNGRFLLQYIGVNVRLGSWQLFDLESNEVVASGHGQSRISATWAPDSQRFAYLEDGAVCIYNLEGKSDECTAVSNNLIGATWSPVGEHIAIAAGNFDAPGFTGQVWLLYPDSGVVESIGTYETSPHGTVEDLFEWTADGSQFLIKSSSENVTSLLYNVANSTIQPFSQPVKTISPDGRTIIYNSGMVENLDSGVTYALPTNEACPHVPFGLHNWDWSPDGTRLGFLLFCHNNEETSWLSIFGTSSGEVLWQRKITAIDSSFSLQTLYWSPADDYLFLEEPDSAFKGSLSPIWRIAVDGSGEIEPFFESGFLIGVVPQWAQEGGD